MVNKDDWAINTDEKETWTLRHFFFNYVLIPADYTLPNSSIIRD